jgi:hypothetical protein
VMNAQAPAESRTSRRFDVSVPHPARMWNYWLGGKDNFAADRIAAELVAQEIPLMPVIARATRRFIIETVQDAARGGVRQFLDIGTGLPAAASTHQIAQVVAPDARVVYVDNDPLVASHAQALLADAGAGLSDFAELDLRDPGAIVDRAAKTLDFGQPVVILLAAVLHFIPDFDDPWAIADRLKEVLAPGSYLLIAHAASDIEAAAVAAMASDYNERGALPITPRSRQQVTRFLDGLTLAGPGVAPVGRWWQPGAGDGPMAAYFGLGRKP